MKIGTLLGAVAGGIVTFLLGFLFFGILLADYFKADMIEYAGLLKDPPMIALIFLFNVTFAWLISWALDYGGGSGWAEGAKVGAIVLFVISLGMFFEFEAFMNIHKSLAPTLVHLLVVMVMGAAGGAVIGIVQGYFKRERAL
ncbi:MAG: hypothetical protein ABI857_11845 [Acidobacteriota bacterium]